MAKRTDKKPGDIVRITPRQEKTAKLYAENIASKSNKTKKEIIKQAGYSDKVAKNPNKVMNTVGFRKALQKYLPIEHIANRHAELLEQDDDKKTAIKAVELAYRVHGVRSETGGSPYSNFLQVINLADLSDKARENIIDQ